MQEYVAVLVFNKNKDLIALIRKDRPDFLAGKLNGIGGKIEKNEDIHDAVERELLEETGHRFDPWDTHQFATLTGDFGKVHFFKAFMKDEILHNLKCPESEEIEVHSIYTVSNESLAPHLEYLIPMALNGNIDIVEIKESYSS